MTRVTGVPGLTLEIITHTHAHQNRKIKRQPLDGSDIIHYLKLGLVIT